jgi:AcrR family transcriptional regulator
VPKTRPSKPKDQKVAEILSIAEEQLRGGGYEALSVAAVARRLGLAPNAIYWYFPSKDHLFVGALERMLRDIVARKPKSSKSATERILWFVDEFAALSELQRAMTERARTSKVVRSFVSAFDEVLQRMLANAFRDHMLDAELPLAIASFRATTEGTFAQGLSPKERRRVLRFALDRITDGKLS